MKHACLEEDRNINRYRDKSRQRKSEWDRIYRNEKTEVKNCNEKMERKKLLNSDTEITKTANCRKLHIICIRLAANYFQLGDYNSVEELENYFSHK